MSFLAKRELLARVVPRYQTATPQQKSVILDEFVAVTGYARKYAIRLLARPVPVPLPLSRPRERFYGAAVQDALVVAWTAANRICAKRLVPFLPELVPVLERHGHLTLTDAVREQLLALSPATADRLLHPYRERDAPRGMTTTRRGLLIKQHAAQGHPPSVPSPAGTTSNPVSSRPTSSRTAAHGRRARSSIP